MRTLGDEVREGSLETRKCSKMKGNAITGEQFIDGIHITLLRRTTPSEIQLVCELCYRKQLS